MKAKENSHSGITRVFLFVTLAFGQWYCASVDEPTDVSSPEEPAEASVPTVSSEVKADPREAVAQQEALLQKETSSGEEAVSQEADPDTIVSAVQIAPQSAKSTSTTTGVAYESGPWRIVHEVLGQARTVWMRRYEDSVVIEEHRLATIWDYNFDGLPEHLVFYDKDGKVTQNYFDFDGNGVVDFQDPQEDPTTSVSAAEGPAKNAE